MSEWLVLPSSDNPLLDPLPQREPEFEDPTIIRRCPVCDAPNDSCFEIPGVT